MVTYGGHASPAAGDQTEREEESMEILYGENNIIKTVSILKKYGVQYIILNRPHSEKTTATRLLRKFALYPHIFEEIYKEDDFTIYKITKV